MLVFKNSLESEKSKQRKRPPPQKQNKVKEEEGGFIVFKSNKHSRSLGGWKGDGITRPLGAAWD
jgi:hypothetical protein